jgi:hypothetical protein
VLFAMPSSREISESESGLPAARRSRTAKVPCTPAELTGFPFPGVRSATAVSLGLLRATVAAYNDRELRSICRTLLDERSGHVR